MFQKFPKTTGAAISKLTLRLDDAAPKCEVLIQHYFWHDNRRGRVGYGWDVSLVWYPSKVIFRVLDNTTIFNYLNDVNYLYWVTPVSKVIDIGQLADLNVKIT